MGDGFEKLSIAAYQLICFIWGYSPSKLIVLYKRGGNASDLEAGGSNSISAMGSVLILGRLTVILESL